MEKFQHKPYQKHNLYDFMNVSLALQPLSRCLCRYVWLCTYMSLRRGSRGGGALGPAPTPGTEGPAPKPRVPSSQGQKEGTLVSLEWLFNIILCVCVHHKLLIPIPYKVINPLAASPGRNPGSAPEPDL